MFYLEVKQQISKSKEEAFTLPPYDYSFLSIIGLGNCYRLKKGELILCGGSVCSLISIKQFSYKMLLFYIEKCFFCDRTKNRNLSVF